MTSRIVTQRDRKDTTVPNLMNGPKLHRWDKNNNSCLDCGIYREAEESENVCQPKPALIRPMSDKVKKAIGIPTSNEDE